MGLTALDIVVLLLVGGGAVQGAIRGFVTEVLSLLAWVATVFALKFLHTPATDITEAMVGTRAGAAVLSFVLIFAIVYILFKLLASAMGRRMRQSVLGPVDRVLGLGFGGLKGLLIATLLFLAAMLAVDTWSGASAPRPAWLRESRTFPLLNASGRAVVDFVEERRRADEADEAAEAAMAESGRDR